MTQKKQKKTKQLPCKTKTTDKTKQNKTKITQNERTNKKSISYLLFYLSCKKKIVPKLNLTIKTTNKKNMNYLLILYQSFGNVVIRSGMSSFHDRCFCPLKHKKHVKLSLSTIFKSG